MNLPNEPKTDQKRLILAVALSTGILLLWYALFPPAAPRPPGPAEGPAAATAGAPATSAVAAPTSAAPYAGVPAQVVATLAAPGRQTVEFTNRGGDIGRWLIHEDQYLVVGPDGRSGPFVMALPPERGFTRGSFLPPLLDVTLGDQVVQAVYAGENGPDAAVLSAVDSKSGVAITRRYTLDPQRYGVLLTLTLKNPGGAPVPYDLSALLRAAQNADEAAGNMFSPPIHLFHSLCARAETFEREAGESIADSRADGESTRFADGIRWAGVDNRYFLTAMVPEGQKDGERIEACELLAGHEATRVAPDEVAPRTQYLATRVDLEGGVVPPNGEVTRTLRFFAGPKKHDVLHAVTPPMGDAIDFGIFRIVCIPMLWLMQRFFDLFANWGIAIILLTIVVKILTLPLTHKQYKSMAGMKKVQPMLKALQDKYKDDRLKLQQEMMKLYKEHNVNPFSGCLPVLMMMPVYIALYQTIYSSVELFQADFALWIKDLSEKDPTFVLPLLLGGLMLLQARLSPTTGDATQQKIMMYFMPILFTLMMAFLPSGLVLYIAVNTGLGIAQQWWMMRRYAEPVPVPAPAKARGR